MLLPVDSVEAMGVMFGMPLVLLIVASILCGTIYAMVLLVLLGIR